MEMSDEELLEELKERLDKKNRALFDLEAANRNLELMNEKLQESEKLKTNFLSNIRNEINNPLTALIGLSSGLASLKGLEDREKIEKIAGMIHSEAVNLDFQIRNILTAADLEAGESELYMTKTEVVSLLDECLSNLSSMVKEYGIEVKREGPEEIWINTDVDKLCIIILNLISNGIIFNREGGLLELKYGLDGDEFFFSVTDNGIGIAPEHQNEIFDRFRQLDIGVSKRFKGHGLGLSVAKAGVELLGGSIGVESTPGEGSTFTLIVPAMAEAETEGISVEGTELFFDDEDDDVQEF